MLAELEQWGIDANTKTQVAAWFRCCLSFLKKCSFSVTQNPSNDHGVGPFTMNLVWNEEGIAVFGATRSI